VHSTQLSLFAPVKKKPSNVPVFLIYAGIIHAIGLALLLPMIVTLPGPGGDLTPQTSVIDVEIIPAPATTANVVGENEETAALPHKDEPASGDATIEPVGNVEPDVKPAEEPETPPAQEEREEPEVTFAPSPAAAPEQEKPKADAATAKKPVRSARPATRRSAKTQLKIAPFNGALSGLFAPAPPGSNRKR
jgi:hypothetical protein